MWRGHGRGSDVTVQAFFNGHGHWHGPRLESQAVGIIAEQGISVLTCFQGLSGLERTL